MSQFDADIIEERERSRRVSELIGGRVIVIVCTWDNRLISASDEELFEYADANGRIFKSIADFENAINNENYYFTSEYDMIRFVDNSDKKFKVI
jgi:hypothetical protein